MNCLKKSSSIKSKINRKNIQKLRLAIQIVMIALVIFAFSKGAGFIGWYLFLTILFFGVFYCGWLCPFGAWQDLLAKFSTRLNIKKYKAKPHHQRYLQISRYFIYALSVIGIVYLPLNACKTMNQNLFQGTATLIALFFFGLFTIAAIFIDRPYCNYFCAKGALFGMLSRFRLFSIKRDDKCCIHCKLCTKVCPMNIEVEKTDFVTHPNCINCFTCISKCPKNCLSYGQKNNTDLKR